MNEDQYTPEDFHQARLYGSYDNAAIIARWLAEKPDGSKDEGWIKAAERMEDLCKV